MESESLLQCSQEPCQLHVSSPSPLIPEEIALLYKNWIGLTVDLEIYFDPDRNRTRIRVSSTLLPSLYTD
jgi:hypothetical protein